MTTNEILEIVREALQSVDPSVHRKALKHIHKILSPETESASDSVSSSKVDSAKGEGSAEGKPNPGDPG